MSKIAAWLTPERRRAIYGLVAAGAICLTAFGVVTQDQLNQWVQSASGIIAALTSLLALFYVPKNTD